MVRLIIILFLKFMFFSSHFFYYYGFRRSKNIKNKKIYKGIRVFISLILFKKFYLLEIIFFKKN